MSIIYILLITNISYILTIGCSSVPNPLSLTDCSPNGNDRTLCCFSTNLATNIRSCRSIEDNSFIDNSIQTISVSGTNFKVECPSLDDSQKCNYYKKPPDYKTCSNFSNDKNLCCLARLNKYSNESFCYWDNNMTYTYGQDTIFEMTTVVDTLWAITNGAKINKINAFDAEVVLNATKTCYGIALDSQKNCSTTKPDNNTNCAWANTRDNICCLLKLNGTNDQCIWVKNITKTCITETINFNSITYTRDCRFSRSDFLAFAKAILVYFIFVFFF